MNTIGNLFRLTTTGESHGPQITVIVDGVPPGIAIDLKHITKWLKKRRPGFTSTSTKRREPDIPEILSGIFQGYSTGAPITVVVKNQDIKSSDYDNVATVPRPGHADFPAYIASNGHRDFRGGGIHSGRLTIGHVIGGAIAQQIVKKHFQDIQVKTSIKEISGSKDTKQFEKLILEAKQMKDSVGGIIEVKVNGLPIGWGNPLYLPVESLIANLIFTIPAITGIEFGDGFKGAKKRGSKHNDAYSMDQGKIILKSNNCGGVLGGLTTGSPLIYRVSVKPTSSIGIPQETVDLSTRRNTSLTLKGRHDPCIVPRAKPVLEAITWMAIADLMLLSCGLNNQK